jgi:hypothetical protein
LKSRFLRRRASCRELASERATAGELTIVIPAKNELTMLPKLLASLARQD